MRKKPDEISKIVAEMYGVSERYVRMVRSGEREDEDILASIMDLIEGKNKLIEEVESLIPVEKRREKRPKTTYGDLRNGRKGGQLSLENPLF